MIGNAFNKASYAIFIEPKGCSSTHGTHSSRLNSAEEIDAFCLRLRGGLIEEVTTKLEVLFNENYFQTRLCSDQSRR